VLQQPQPVEVGNFRLKIEIDKHQKGKLCQKKPLKLQVHNVMYHV